MGVRGRHWCDRGLKSITQTSLHLVALTSAQKSSPESDSPPPAGSIKQIVSVGLVKKYRCPWKCLKKAGLCLEALKVHICRA